MNTRCLIVYPPTALKRQAPSSFIFLMTNPFFSRSAFSNQCSCCNRGRISEKTQWEFIIKCSINRQSSNEKVIVGNIYFAHQSHQEHHKGAHIFMHQQHQNSCRQTRSCLFTKLGWSQVIMNWSTWIADDTNNVYFLQSFIIHDL